MITSFFGFVSSAAVCLIFLGGAFFAYGLLPMAFILSALGAGWLGILYSTLLRGYAPKP